MTMLTLPAAPAATHRFDLRDLFREPLFAGAGLVLALLALPTAAALVFDGRLFQGVDLAGLDIRRAKIASYAIGGAMAALAGLATVALTGTGDPRFSVGANATLNSVAAIVLGGVALVGGTGSVVGVVAAGVILVMLNPILSAMGIDPNSAQVIQGVLIAGLMMIGGLVALLRERAA
jgi:ribose/xylose/arabinose/galactoside ABC-type transport system permease subunit